jgi:hypothetical protein
VLRVSACEGAHVGEKMHMLGCVHVCVCVCVCVSGWAGAKARACARVRLGLLIQ